MSTSLLGLKVCVQINITVCATLTGTGVFPWAWGCFGGCLDAVRRVSRAPAASTMFDVPAVDHVSSVSPVQAAEIALRQYGIAGTAERLASEHDDTFRLVGTDGVARLLKI